MRDERTEWLRRRRMHDERGSLLGVAQWLAETTVEAVG